MHPSLWALWKIGAKITPSLSRSALLAAAGLEHRPLYSQPLAPAPSSSLAHVTWPVSPGLHLFLLSQFCKLLGLAQSKAKPRGAAQAASAWRSPQCPGDTKEPSLCVMGLWEPGTAPPAGDIRGEVMDLASGWQVSHLGLDLADRAGLGERGGEPGKPSPGPAAPRVTAHCAHRVLVQQDMKSPCWHNFLLSLLSDTETLLS